MLDALAAMRSIHVLSYWLNHVERIFLFQTKQWESSSARCHKDPYTVGVCYPIWFVFLPPPLPLVYQQQAQQLLYPDLKRHFMYVKPETPSPEPTTSVVILPFCLTALHLYTRKKSKRTGTSQHPLKKDVTESRQFDAIDVGNLCMIGGTHPLRHRQGLSSGHRPETLSKEDWLCLSRFLLPNKITNPNNWWFH